MKYGLSGGLCAAVLALGIGVSGQTPTQTPPPQTDGGKLGAQSITVSGCVQRETEYRRAHKLGRGGPAGSGAGVANEFVLVNAATDATVSGTTAPGGTRTTGAVTATTAGAVDAYEITGTSERQLSQHLGKRVEITGRLKSMDTTKGVKVTGSVATGNRDPNSGGTTPGSATASGSVKAGQIDPMGQDLMLRELEIVSVRGVAGTCAPAAR